MELLEWYVIALFWWVMIYNHLLDRITKNKLLSYLIDLSTLIVALPCLYFLYTLKGLSPTLLIGTPLLIIILCLFMQTREIFKKREKNAAR